MADVDFALLVAGVQEGNAHAQFVVFMDGVDARQVEVGDRRAQREANGGVGCDLLVVSDGGFGKRTALKEYRRQGRAGYGVLTAKMPEGRSSSGRICWSC